MIKYGELITALQKYTCVDSHELIPDELYRTVIKLAIRKNREQQQWDIQHVAAALLYLAFHDGHLIPQQLTPAGLRALDWAELLIDDQDISPRSNESKSCC